MSDRPSILVLDDGELDNVHRMLRQLELDAVRLKGPEIKRRVDAPRDLLITAGRRTLGNMPELVFPDGVTERPVWVCIHNQDFLPLRERLCEMGVHYLLQNALDEDSRRRFLLQLLRSGGERRGKLRLPLGGEIHYEAGGEGAIGSLVELSVEGCRILAASPLEIGASVSALLPPSLGGGDALELSGTVLRTAPEEVHGGRTLHPTVLRFDALDEDRRTQLESIIRGERIGTRITALAEPTGVPAGPVDTGSKADAPEETAGTPSPDATSPADDTAGTERPVEERRGEARHVYAHPVQLLGNEEPVLACDLSMSGVRLAESEGLEDGAEVQVALYGAPREEPVLLSAQVVRSAPGSEAALRFGPMTAAERAALERLLRTEPVLDALDRPDAEAGRTVIAEVRAAV